MAVGNRSLDKKILADLAARHAENHGRIRVYPQAADGVIRLTAAAVVNTFGSWVECIPAGVIPFRYHVVGILVEGQQAADTFLVQLGTGIEIIGEMRMSLGGLAGWYPFYPVEIQSQGVVAGTPVFGRMKAASADGNWVDISLTVTRHFSLTQHISLRPGWPW